MDLNQLYSDHQVSLDRAARSTTLGSRLAGAPRDQRGSGASRSLQRLVTVGGRRLQASLQLSLGRAISRLSQAFAL